MSQPQEPAGRVPNLGRFRLGDWSVHQGENILCSEGGSLRLEPRVMDVLVYLAARSRKVVAKEELLEAVWGGAFVEEGALSQAIHSLRKALGDDARQPRYIQTVPKRGYQLLEAVVPEDDGPAAAGIDPPPRPPMDLMFSSPALIASPAAPVPWRSRKGVRLWMAVACAAVVAAVLVFLWWSGAERRKAGTGTRPSDAIRIVVLPFENLGSPGDAFFADGLTEEITKDLASLKLLRVISRTSALQYAGARKPLPQIGRELGVDYVLEGTVRWAKGAEGQPRVRITPQLIRVSDDAHIWADAFERQVEDIFEVQAEISQKVIQALDITLLPQEQEPGPQPTTNMEAYWAYVRGMQLKNQPFYSEDYLRKAVSMLELAVDLDPGFAVAWAELSQTHSYLAFNTDPSRPRVAKARHALERALAIAPDLPEVRVAQAYFTYRCVEDFDAALAQLSEAAELYPNDAGILETLGLVLRRKGRLSEAIQVLQDASTLSPRSAAIVWTIAETHRALRDFERADHHFGRAISLAPDEAFFWEERALNRVAWSGDVRGARAILDKAPNSAKPGLAAAVFQFDLYERRYEQALARLSADWVGKLSPHEQSHLAMLAAMARVRLGQQQAALRAAEENRAALEELMSQFPQDPAFRAYLAVALAQLGQPAEALAQAEQAVRLKRHDAFSGPLMIETQAIVDSLLGRHSEAIGRLSHLLALDYRSSITVAELSLDPIWDPLRSDPAFRNLLRTLEVDRSE